MHLVKRTRADGEEFSQGNYRYLLQRDDLQEQLPQGDLQEWLQGHDLQYR